MFSSKRGWRWVTISAIAFALFSGGCEPASACKKWQVKTVKIKSSQKEQALAIEEGWEPFGNVAIRRVWLRRCAQ